MNAVEITAQDVKALRERTGAGMMDCKKALTESDGDVDRAIEILRVSRARRCRISASGRDRGDGPGLHPCGREGGGPDRGRLQHRLRRQQRRVRGFARDVAMQIAAADRRLCEPRRHSRGRSATPRPGSTSRKPRTSPRMCARRSSRASSTRGTRRSCCSSRRMHNPEFEGKTVQQLRDELTAKTGENVVIRRFAASRSASRPSGRIGSPAMAPAFKRILLKLSGEALMGELPYGTDPERVRRRRAPGRATCATRAWRWRSSSAPATSTAA